MSLVDLKGMVNIIEHVLPTKNHVAHIYRKLMQNKSDDSFYTKRNWELELNTIIENEMWLNICAICHMGISSQIWKEFDWKMKIRFFRVPIRYGTADLQLKSDIFYFVWLFMLHCTLLCL